MIDATLPPANETAEDLKKVVVDGIKDDADGVSTAIDECRKPGQPLDVLAKVTGGAPLAALLVALLFGAALARRRHG